VKKWRVKMILNNIEKDIKMKCLENDTTQLGLAEKIGKTGQYINRIVKKNDGVLNKTFVQMMEGLGYDIELIYVKREDRENE
jgi:plasmid maintenance system antidote protein VapI